MASTALQCRREVGLVFVYSNQSESLVSHCELWVTRWELDKFDLLPPLVQYKRFSEFTFFFSFFPFLLVCTVSATAYELYSWAYDGAKLTDIIQEEVKSYIYVV